MSIWADIHRRANGVQERKEDTAFERNRIEEEERRIKEAKKLVEKLFPADHGQWIADYYDEDNDYSDNNKYAVYNKRNGWFDKYSF